MTGCLTPEPASLPVACDRWPGLPCGPPIGGRPGVKPLWKGGLLLVEPAGDGNTLSRGRRQHLVRVGGLVLGLGLGLRLGLGLGLELGLMLGLGVGVGAPRAARPRRRR